jgi:Arc/MetJ-type ribon-helix-helix transcriptional regulator
MSDKQYNFRLPDQLMKKIDRQVEKQRRETGMALSRNDIVRALLTKAVAAIEKPGLAKGRVA